MLVPTVRHGDQFRRRLVGRCGVALRLRVETIARLSRELGPGRAATSLVRWPASSSSRTARREIERGPAAYFEPIAGTSGFADLLSAAVDDLLSEAIRPARPIRSRREIWLPRPDRTRRYLCGLQLRARAPWLGAPGADRVGRCRRRAGRPARRRPSVMLDGFQVFRGSELVLLEALADTSEVVSHARSLTREPELATTTSNSAGRFPNAQVVAVERRSGSPAAGRDGGQRGRPRGPDARHRETDQAAPDR